MSRENTYTSIILKKQPYGEGDEIITVFTKELGKLRVLAKSTKLAKSKLQYGLQVLFMSKLTVTHSNLPKVIGAETLKTFSRIRENLDAAKIVYYALELVLKFTPDEQKNEELFLLFADFLDFLDRSNVTKVDLMVGLAKFKIGFLDALGFAIHADKPSSFTGIAGFSNSLGGFLFGEKSSDARPVALKTYNQFKYFKTHNFKDILVKAEIVDDCTELQDILAVFLEYHLERGLKSAKFMES